MITRERLIALAKTNLLGSQVDVQPGLPAAIVPPQTTQLVSLQGDVGDAGPWTVTLAGPNRTLVTGIGVQAAAGIPDLFARISYGVGDNMQIVDVDWCHGVQVTVFGAQISVEVVAPFNRPAGVNIGPVSASVAPGVRATGQPPQRTIRFGENGLVAPTPIAAGVTDIIVIPQMARRVRHSCVASAALARTLQILDPIGTVIAQYAYANSTGRIFPQWAGGDMIDLPRSASRVAITNNDAALSMTQVHAVFDLAC